jgi:RNA polymerase sigma factor (sigma-70 family)
MNAQVTEQGSIPAARRGPGWTDDQKRFLRENVGALSHREIGERIGKSAKVVGKMVCRMGLVLRRRWTEEEDDFIRRNKGRMTFEEIGRRLGRTATTVGNRSGDIGVARRQATRDPATAEEVRRLRGDEMTDAQIAERLGLNPMTIGRIRRKLGLPRLDWNGPRARALAFQSCRRSGRAARYQDAVNRSRLNRAVEMGWPQARTELQARILRCLSSGPKLAKEVSATTGQAGRHGNELTFNGPMRGLVRRGLVVAMPVPGRRERLYGLAPGVKPRMPGDPDAPDPMQYDRLVCKLAIKHGADRRTVKDSDQYIAGLEGLASAYDKWRPDGGASFMTYAHNCIQNAIRRSFRKLPGPRLMAFSQMAGDDGEGDRADDLAVARDDETPMEADEDAGERAEAAARLLGGLDERSRAIVRMHVMEGKTMDEIGRSLDPPITRARVQQIVQGALASMRRRAESAEFASA